MNLFVSNISHLVKDGALKELFGAIGEVTSAKIVNDRYTGESRGFGFVEMSNDVSGALAIKQLSGANFFGRNLVVSLARPRTDRRADSSGSGRY